MPAVSNKFLKAITVNPNIRLNPWREKTTCVVLFAYCSKLVFIVTIFLEENITITKMDFKSDEVLYNSEE